MSYPSDQTQRRITFMPVKARRRVDPDLIGQWRLPGQPQIYEITGDGAYHISEPAAQLRFEDGGAGLVWQDHRYFRMSGRGETPVGAWREVTSRDVWIFDADGTYTVKSACVEGWRTFSGIWGLAEGNQQMWVREMRAFVKSDQDAGALTMLTVHGHRLHYGYHKSQDGWSLRDVSNGRTLTRFRNARSSQMDPMATAAQ
ncbi:hypothetical protein V8J82_11005 [Gymnodinialimonas sp. 2305UL16-5]|uniref:hypothetical protein n=1 Tax=Gymnodinialimonas mytili TaxID=3126503 RepID=UPI00309DFCE0